LLETVLIRLVALQLVTIGALRRPIRSGEVTKASPRRWRRLPTSAS